MDAAAPLFGELVTERLDGERAGKGHGAYQVVAVPVRSSAVARRERCPLIATGIPASHDSSVKIQDGGGNPVSSKSCGGHRTASGVGLSQYCRWGGRQSGRRRLLPGQFAGP
jgi:hypothetical protein